MCARKKKRRICGKSILKKNTIVGTENGGPKRRRASYFLLVPRLSIARVLPLFLSVSVFFSLVENMERSLSCDKAVACEMGERDPSRRGVGLPCQSAPLRAVMRTCFIHTSFTEPFCAQTTSVWLHVSEILKHSGKSSERLDMHEFWRLFCGLFSSLLRGELRLCSLKPPES